MNWNKAKLPLEILGILLVIVIAGWGLSKFSTPKSALYSSADKVRKDAQGWERRLTPKAVLPFAPKDKIWEEVRITSDTKGVRIEMPKPSILGNFFPVTRHEMQYGETLTLASSTLRLAAIGSAWCAADAPDKEKAPYRWFGPNGKTEAVINSGAWKVGSGLRR